MAVMRSIMYVPGNNPKMVEKAPSIPADIITLDLEDSVPPSEKEAARKLVAEKLKYAGSGGAPGIRPHQQLGNRNDQRRPPSRRMGRP